MRWKGIIERKLQVAGPGWVGTMGRDRKPHGQAGSSNLGPAVWARQDWSKVLEDRSGFGFGTYLAHCHPSAANPVSSAHLFFLQLHRSPSLLSLHPPPLFPFFFSPARDKDGEPNSPLTVVARSCCSVLPIPPPVTGARVFLIGGSASSVANACFSILLGQIWG